MKKLILLTSVFMLMFAVNSCGKRSYDTNTELYGIVSNFATGEPIGGATVTLSPGGRNQVTGTDGRFEFKDLDPQQYTLTAQRSGYQTNRRTITAVVGEKTEVNITLTQN